jgi:release factor glutamine methyltransferase
MPPAEWFPAPAVSPPASLTFPGIVAALRGAGCVFAEEEAALLMAECSGPAELARGVQRRRAGIPLEYVLGWAEFFGQRIEVGQGVFVPRRRTELLVQTALELLAPTGQALSISVPSSVVVDLCCGSGAVGAALLAVHPKLELHAADLDPAAVAYARRNVGKMGGRVYEGDLFAALPVSLRGRVQVLAVNAPYVPSDAIRTMPPEARLHEPRLSLDGGPDGLDIHRLVAASAPGWLRAGGHLLVETSEQQAAGTESIVAATGLAARTVRSEELDGTVVVGTKVS